MGERNERERKGSNSKRKRLGKKNRVYRRQKSSTIVQAEKKTSGKKGTKIFAGIVLFLFLINIVSSLAGEIQEFFMERNYQVADESDPYAQTDAVLRETGAFF